MSYRYKLTIEYLGAGYQGWQRQDHGPSVQQTIEDVIKNFTNKDTTLFAAGRTDTGVNAYGQVAHFDIEEYFDPFRLTASLNHFLKNANIGILKTELVSNEFHARFSARQRHYVYKIKNRRSVNIIDAAHKTWVKEPLDISKMQQASEYLVGNHDYSSFRSSICQSKSALKTIEAIRIEQYGEDIEIYISALSFLHHMVRNIVGTLIFVGIGKWPPESVKEILELRDRSAAGPTAPAHGLYFLKVDYDAN